jgi:SAM-dependent methyltransferase
MTNRQKINSENLPEGYELHNNCLRVKNRDGRIKLELELISRSFEKYDQFFQGLLSKILSEDKKLNVLDIGGGYDSLAIQEINNFYPKINASNIDPFAENSKYSIKGFAESLPFSKSSLDIIISVNCIFHFLASKEDRGPKMVEEVERVLKPQGMFFLFPGYDLNQVNNDLEQVVQLYNTNTFGKVYMKK